MRCDINVHIYPSKLTHESRILRITDTLIKFGMFKKIEVYGIADGGLPSVESIDADRTFFRIPFRLFKKSRGFIAKSLRTLLWSWDLYSLLKQRPIVCVNAHSLAVLPLCALIAYRTGAKLVYDTHELETETIGSFGVRRILGRVIERVCIRRASLVIVVSDGIADWYRDRYAICRPSVIRNVPYVFAKNNSLDLRREDFSLPQNEIIFIYQGGFSRGRGIERILKVFSVTPTVHLVLMGSGNLYELIKNYATKFNNIHIIDSVSTDEVLSYTKLADVGICLTENNCLSHYFSLPNKIFEYVQAGLPVLVNSLIEQEKIVETYGCGWVAPLNDNSFIDLLAEIRSSDLSKLEKNINFASQQLNWNLEELKLLDAYRHAGFISRGRLFEE